MTVAVLTMLYGALVANLFALPMAAELKQRTADEQPSVTAGVRGR
jgi:flagellar motor component MotA